MYDYKEEKYLEEDKKRIENLGMNYDKVEKDIEETIGKLYIKNNRKPTRGEILSSLINEYGYNVSDIDVTVTNHTRGML